MTSANVDIFRNVHKGIRKALSDACQALGRAGDDEARGKAARELLAAGLRFVEHHGDNEDALLLPALEGKAQELVRELQRDHEALHGRIVALREALGSASCDELYAGACAFTAAYFEHMHEEEQRHEAVIRAHLSVDELTTFARKSVERTAPSDQRMMLGFVVPAITDADANALLARLPAALASELRLLRNAAG